MKLRLQLQLGVLEAEDALKGDTRHLTGDQYEALVYAATGSRKAAARAKQRRRCAQLDAGVKVT